jgi:hypothetical protein
MNDLIFYCIYDDGELHIVSESFYIKHRKILVAVAVGTIEEIFQFLNDNLNEE